MCGYYASIPTAGTPPSYSGPNVTLVAALTSIGLHAAMTGSEAVNGDIFATCLDQVPGPTLVPGDVVVPENLLAHKKSGLAELVEALSARLLCLLPHSPDLNPILTRLHVPPTSSKPGFARPRHVSTTP